MHLEMGRACPHRVQIRVVSKMKIAIRPMPSVKLSVRPAMIAANKPNVALGPTLPLLRRRIPGSHRHAHFGDSGLPAGGHDRGDTLVRCGGISPDRDLQALVLPMSGG